MFAEHWCQVVQLCIHPFKHLVQRIATPPSVNDTAVQQNVVEDKPFFTLQRNNIHIGSTLLEGTFGSIFHATLQIPGMPLKDVIVKTVKSNYIIYF